MNYITGKNVDVKYHCPIIHSSDQFLYTLQQNTIKHTNKTGKETKLDLICVRVCVFLCVCVCFFLQIAELDFLLPFN